MAECIIFFFHQNNHPAFGTFFVTCGFVCMDFDSLSHGEQVGGGPHKGKAHVVSI